MKFQLIFLILIFIDFSFSKSDVPAVPRGRLSEEENEKRLEDCGRGGIAIPPKLTYWFWVAYTALPILNGARLYTTAVVISSRHLLTSSTPLLDQNRKWRHNGEVLDGNCGKGEKHAEIPPEVLNHLQLQPLCPKCTSTKPVRAYLLNFCQNSKDPYFPMIVETEQLPSRKGFCLGHTESLQNLGLYSLMNETDMKSSLVDITRIQDRFIEATQIGDGVLVDDIDLQWIVIGISSTDSTTNQKSTFFYRISWLEEDICQLTGICKKETTSTVPIEILETSTTRTIAPEILTTTIPTPDSTMILKTSATTILMSTVSESTSTSLQPMESSSSSLTSSESSESKLTSSQSSESISTSSEASKLDSTSTSTSSAPDNFDSTSSESPFTPSDVTPKSAFDDSEPTILKQPEASRRDPPTIRKQEKEYDYDEFEEIPKSMDSDDDAFLDVENGGNRGIKLVLMVSVAFVGINWL